MFHSYQELRDFFHPHLLQYARVDLGFASCHFCDSGDVSSQYSTCGELSRSMVIHLSLYFQAIFPVYSHYN